MKQMRQINSNLYTADDGTILVRINHEWVYLDHISQVVDKDQYRYDVAERNGLELK